MAESNQYQQFLYYAYDLQVRLQASKNALAQLNTLIDGISMTYSVIQELIDKPAGQEIILPLGSYAALKATIPDPSNMLVTIGQKTLVEQDSKTALEIIRKKREELQKQRDNVMKQVDELQNDYDKIEPQLQVLQQAIRAQQQGNLPPKPPSQ